MTGIKTFLPTTGGNAGELFDAGGDRILITDTAAREAIAGGVVPVDIGTRPNANDGDPLRTSFSKINNFVLASYQNDSDVQERVSALEAGAVFLGLFRADQLPRRSLPLRDPGNGGPWTASIRYPDPITGDLFDELNPTSVPDLETNVDATDVYAMISRPVEGQPALSVIIDNIRDNDTNGTLNVAVVFPSAIMGSTSIAPTTGTSDQLPVGGTSGDPLVSFPALRASNFQIGDTINTAQEIVETIRDFIMAEETATGLDYFSFNIEAPTEDTRRLVIDYNVTAVTGAIIPPMLVTIETATPSLDDYVAALSIISSGNTRDTGISALPWLDQGITNTLTVIPAYTMFQWTMNGWSVADQGRGDINSEYLFFDDSRTATGLTRTGDDVTTSLDLTTFNKEVTSDGTRDAITEVQQFGINYVHNVTIDAGEY